MTQLVGVATCCILRLYVEPLPCYSTNFWAAHHFNVCRVLRSESFEIQLTAAAYW